VKGSQHRVIGFDSVTNTVFYSSESFRLNEHPTIWAQRLGAVSPHKEIVLEPYTYFSTIVNGKYLIFEDSPNVLIRNLQTGAQLSLSSEHSAGLSVSPDLRHVAFTTYIKNSDPLNTEIRIVPIVLP
jgi:hypothetical protein